MRGAFVVGVYRFYFVGPEGHFIGVPAERECGTDDDAIHAASELARGRDVEIWQDERQIAVVAKGKTAKLRVSGQ